jgi:hypothetical protein
MTTNTDVTPVAPSADESSHVTNSGPGVAGKPLATLAGRECMYGLAAIAAALLLIFS